MAAHAFAAQFQQICVEDCYRLHSVPFTPARVFDVGANVGSFTSYSRFLWPEAEIIAVEPDPKNWELLLMHTGHLPNVVHVNKAIGTGPLWRATDVEVKPPWYGGLCRYVSEGQLGFPREWLAANENYEPAPEIDVISLADLVSRYGDLGPAVLKVDIEGAENCIFGHDRSIAALRQMDHITMEIHFPLDGTGPVREAGKPSIRERLFSLQDTHECVMDDKYNSFHATRKVFDEQRSNHVRGR